MRRSTPAIAQMRWNRRIAGDARKRNRLLEFDLQGRLMTIKWVKVDPLVMNGEPFCYGTRLTVRQLLELRRNGYGLTELIKDHPELRRLGIAAAYAYAADQPRALRGVLRARRLAGRPGLLGGRGG